MFDMLLESRHQVPGLPRWGAAVAVALHAAVVAAIIRPAPTQAAPPRVIPEEMFPAPEQPGPRASAGSEPKIPDPVDFPLPLPPLPPIPGIPGAPGSPVGPPSGDPASPPNPFLPDSNEPLLPSLVQELPELLTAPVPAYPRLLQEAGVAGDVTVQVVVDTLGRPEAGSLRVVQSSNAGFDAAALATIRSALFRPGRVWGRAVRVLVRVPVAFRLHP